MTIDECEYYRSRLEREERAADKAASATVARVHRELAELYRQRLDLMAPEQLDA